MIIRRIVLAGAAFALAAAPALAPAAAQARACSPTGQNIRVTHDTRSATVHIITRRCGRSYRAWALIGGVNVKSPWITSGSATAWRATGRNEEGGYGRQPTGGGTTIYHISY